MRRKKLMNTKKTISGKKHKQLATTLNVRLVTKTRPTTKHCQNPQRLRHSQRLRHLHLRLRLRLRLHLHLHLKTLHCKNFHYKSQFPVKEDVLQPLSLSAPALASPCGNRKGPPSTASIDLQRPPGPLRQQLEPANPAPTLTKRGGRISHNDNRPRPFQ